jgi:hypothetical protein
MLVEYRYQEGKPDRRDSLVAELVQLKVDVLVLGSLPAIRAAKQATKTIPIVMVTTQDPVASGLVDSLARPGGNITGLTRLTRELSGKRLELLKEVVPEISRVGALLSAQQSRDDFKWYEAPTRSFNCSKFGLRTLILTRHFKLRLRGTRTRLSRLGVPCSFDTQSGLRILP